MTSSIRIPAEILFTVEGSVIIELYGNMHDPAFQLSIISASSRLGWEWSLFSHDDRIIGRGDFGLGGSEELGRLLLKLGEISK